MPGRLLPTMGPQTLEAIASLMAPRRRRTTRGATKKRTGAKRTTAGARVRKTATGARRAAGRVVKRVKRATAARRPARRPARGAGMCACAAR
jgi:hypothetical protein